MSHEIGLNCGKVNATENDVTNLVLINKILEFWAYSETFLSSGFGASNMAPLCLSVKKKHQGILEGSFNKVQTTKVDSIHD